MYGGGTAEVCCAKVQLYFTAAKLKDTDTLSKSDPFMVLSAVTKDSLGQETLHRIGRTETIRDNLNPEWKTSIPMDYYFEQKQELKIKCYDDDGKDPIDTNNELIFEGNCTLASIMSARKHVFTLGGKGDGSSVTITAVETGGNADDEVEMALSARKVKDMDTFSKSDPYFILSRVLPNGKKVELYRSEHIDDNNDPDWKPCPKFRMGQLCGPNLDDLSIEVQLFDKDKFSDDWIGTVLCCFNDLYRTDPHNKASNIEYLTARDKKNADVGHLFARSIKVHKKISFAQHLSMGLQINLALSVDFTGSNGDPRNRTSLHFMDPDSPNEYVRSIMSVGDILLQYDTDKMIPAYGFGARLPDNQVSHFFNLNLGADPSLPGIQGVLDAYGSTLTQIRLSGPTNFQPSISAVTRQAKSHQGVYTVHLILTDGEITDMDQTIDAIVTADDAPLSIVIVGIGNGCDFRAMDQLDGDGGALKNSQGRASRRDLVQFVPFSKFAGNAQALAAEVLREIPRQVEKWYDLVTNTH